MTEREEKAKELFIDKYNCAQSVAGAFADVLGLTPQQTLALSGGFGGGFARLREMCGAVSSMTMVAGAVLERGGASPEHKKVLYEEIQGLVKAFEAENGSYLCRDLLGRSGPESPVPEARTAQYYADRPCLGIVLSAVRLTEKWLAAHTVPATGETVLDEAWLAAHRPVRSERGNKGTFGRVLAVCGSESYRGAAALCCEGALRSGAGLVQLAAVPEVIAAAAARLPELTYFPMKATVLGTIAAINLEPLAACHASAGVLGCGLGCSRETKRFLYELLPRFNFPLVLDADALNALADHPDLLRELQCVPVITPHPGEMARLLHIEIEQVLTDPAACAREFSARCRCVTVLKDSTTVILSPEGEQLTLDAPNSGLAKGGSGDILAGLIAGQLAQGQPPLEAAGCAVLKHSLAAARAVRQKTPETMLASDVLAAL